MYTVTFHNPFTQHEWSESFTHSEDMAHRILWGRQRGYSVVETSTLEVSL